MSSIVVNKRDKSGRALSYRARYRTPDGASRSKVFPKKIDAEQFLANVTTTSAQGAYVDAKAGRITFRSYALKWAASQPHRVTTAVSVESILRVHAFPVLGDLKIAAIRPSQIQAWVSGLKLAPSTAAVAYGKVSAVFRAAVDDNVIIKTPCTRGIRLPRTVGSEVTPMTPVEIRAMVDAVQDRYRALLLLLAGSGLRPGEALGLTVDRVDFLRRTIRVDRQLVTVPGVEPAHGPTKTESSVRTIPVPQVVIDALAAHLDRYSPGPLGLIFTDSKGDGIRRSALGHIWRRAAIKVNDDAAAKKLPPVIVDRTPHDLRHYAASVLIHMGASVKTVQKQLGHASATTTLDCYAHLWPDGEDNTRKALDAGLSQVVSFSCPTVEAESLA